MTRTKDWISASISSMYHTFWIVTAACEATDSSTRIMSLSKAQTFPPSSSALISWMTPIRSPCLLRMGTTSMERVL